MRWDSDGNIYYYNLFDIEYYIKMREFFIELDKENYLKQIKNHINYEKLRKIIRSDWKAYCVQKFLKNTLFYLHHYYLPSFYQNIDFLPSF